MAKEGRLHEFMHKEGHLDEEHAAFEVPERKEDVDKTTVELEEEECASDTEGK
eukprot:CAMPEP_0117445074 /NCGR_PEP_ID=MMETSP0759-20121206/5592_1 /TAXON_ID=63605 /ORGANISM="Percolomonas cosmopolitus, Strain WS" /LENGTH=52 /DNA_ID=CAMNT_0005237207 /DNA_START=137 /DNA_END=295 /DNA_ORIENTATION=+